VRWRLALVSTNACVTRVLRAEPPTLKYALLDACSQFGEVVAQCRALVLASGTLAPLSLLTSQLFRRQDLPRIRTFQCGHVVAAERVLALGVGVGPSSRPLRLTHGVRDAAATVDECGAVLLRLCAIVPQGMVAFVPSFAYAGRLRERCDPPSWSSQQSASLSAPDALPRAQVGGDGAPEPVAAAQARVLGGAGRC